VVQGAAGCGPHGGTFLLRVRMARGWQKHPPAQWGRQDWCHGWAEVRGQVPSFQILGTELPGAHSHPKPPEAQASNNECQVNVHPNLA
jgi:hypothetical protein